MSLIQEALKRQQQESGELAAPTDKPPVQQPANTPISLKRNTPQPAASPVMPPPLPPEESAPAPDQETTETAEETAPNDSKKKKNILVVAIVVVVILLAGGGAWAYMKFMQPKPQPTIVPPQAQTAPATTTTPQPSAPTTPPTEGPAQPTTSVNTSAPVQTVAAPAATVLPPPAPEPPPAPAPEPMPAPEPAPVPAPVEEAVNWPALTLTAVIAGKGDSGSAIINKQVVGVGETIEGVKIIAIRGKTVEVELKGKTQTLRIGMPPQ